MAKEKRSIMADYPDPIGREMRQRRYQLGLSLSELAKKAGIRAPSFIHYIEKGLKIPSEEIARKLARALNADEEIYVAWARMRQRGDIASAMDASMFLHRALGSAKGRPQGASDPADQLATQLPDETMLLANLGMVASLSEAVRAEPKEQTSTPSLLVKIPVLPEGSDPGSGRGDESEPLEVLRVDPRLLMMEGTLVRPFAYRLSDMGAARVPEQLRAGDLAIVTRSAWPLQADEVYAVRIRARVVLTRARWSEETLWAVQGETAESLGTGTPPPALVGRVAVVVRAPGVRPG